MQATISNSLLKNLKPGEQPIEIRDTQLKGLLLRIQPTGLMTYYVEYARGKRAKIGRHPAMTPAQAREVAKEMLGKVYQGGDPTAFKRLAKAQTFESFIDEVYKPWAETHIRTANDTVKRLKSSFPDFQSKKLHEITPWLVEKWRSARFKSGLKASSINRDITDLKSSLAKAVEWGILEEHPIRSVKKSPVDSMGKIRFLSAEEEKELRQALETRESKAKKKRENHNKWLKERKYKLRTDISNAPLVDHLKPLVILSLNTGLRRGELFNLKWPDIDFLNQNLTVQGDGAKSGKTRHVPLNTEALTILRQWEKQTFGNSGKNGLVFPGKNGERLDNVNKSWKTLLEGTSIRDFRWHDLRHTFASKLVMAGVDLNTVRELLGHSDYKMTLRYAHLAPKHKADAVERLVMQ
jgi:integrase